MKKQEIILVDKEKKINKKKFKVAICYPPIESKKGIPLLSQNRQFQYFSFPTYVYPMVPAYAATMAKISGYNVLWMDGIAEKMSYEDWFSDLKENNPNLVLIESKTPVIKTHWKIIKEIKESLPETIVVLVGDHVTFLPIESLENCPVDYVLTGGDYDFLLTDILDCINDRVSEDGGSNKRKKELPGGIFGRKGDKRIKLGDFSKEIDKYWSSGPLELKHNLDNLPFIDRDLTKWKLYAYENGNYKYKPGTYVYSGRDCWWGKCTFCIWDQVLYPQGTYRRFSPKRLFNEVKYLVDKYEVKEIFDDAGTFFIGEPLKEFCNLMIDSGYNKKVVFSCNMRINALTKEYCDLMKKANFRFILYGLESANQETLDKIEKGLKLEEVEPYLKIAKESGLEPHITVMLGYPWETEEMALKTISLSKELFKKGYVDTMQATIVIPYPGSKLYAQCKENDWFAVDPKDYEAFDMRGPVMKVPFSEKKLMELTQELYSSFLTPQYIFRRLINIRSLDDVKFLWYSTKKLIGHLLDFDKSQI
ncbi:MAG: radical SAM protein [Patescibacteria group bacterium]